METTKRGQVSVWKPRRQGIRNEVLDCTVMALFCAHKAALHRKTNAQWQQLKNIIQPDQNDIFASTWSQPEPEAQTPTPAAVIPPKPITETLYIPE